MYRSVSYEECIKFIEHKLLIKLKECQKEIIKCFCEGKEVRTCRGIGRSMCADAFGKYIAYLYDQNNYSIDPDVIVPYKTAVSEGLLHKDLIRDIRNSISQEDFEIEFECKGKCDARVG